MSRPLVDAAHDSGDPGIDLLEKRRCDKTLLSKLFGNIFEAQLAFEGSTHRFSKTVAFILVFQLFSFDQIPTLSLPARSLREWLTLEVAGDAKSRSDKGRSAQSLAGQSEL